MLKLRRNNPSWANSLWRYWSSSYSRAYHNKRFWHKSQTRPCRDCRFRMLSLSTEKASSTQSLSSEHDNPNDGNVSELETLDSNSRQILPVLGQRRAWGPNILSYKSKLAKSSKDWEDSDFSNSPVSRTRWLETERRRSFWK